MDAREYEEQIEIRDAYIEVLESALRAVRGGLCYPDEYFKVADEALNPKR